MTELLLVGQILQRIIEKKLSFSDALKQGIQAESQSVSQGLIRSITSCELHHHRILEHAVLRFFPSLPLADRLVVQAGLGNNVFVRRLPQDQVQNFLTQFLMSKDISADAIHSLLKLAQPGQALIDPNIQVNSVTYFGIKYNTPDWLVSMWMKHYGSDQTLKILATNNRPVLMACRVNTLKTTTEALLRKHPQFVEGPMDNTVIYQAKEPLKSHPAYTQNLVFQQRLAVTDVMNTFSFENVKGEMLLVETRPQALYLELPIYTQQQIKINVITNSIERKLAMQKTLSTFKIQTVKIIESEPKGIITHIPFKQDVVMVIPQCSKFDLIRSLPDFFIHFQQEHLDTLIASEKEALLSSSEFVADGGLLFYSVNTLNLKEGQYLIEDFLSQQPGYKLIQEFHYFPYDRFNTALYVAAMRKQK
jgi:16S rRNA C967 or C1407 C5-methylase (RsmB/RsmF family)